MCGIVGMVNLNNNIIKFQEVLETMVEKLSSRGPDANGTWLSTNALIGHARLIVIDPEGGKQPMIASKGESKCVLTYNGELYNTQDLRYTLESLGHTFNSSSDTEVLLRSYVEWGPSCVKHLNGIYAFAVWDEKEKSLFLARDRFGVKPLFYTIVGNFFIFASELKSLLAHPYVKPEIDFHGLSEIFVLGPSRTPGHGIFKNVFELKPAHCMLYNSVGVHIKRYWQLESAPHTDTVDETVEKCKELVLDSIKRQLVSDVPLCTFLSGGLDSSAITAIAATDFKNRAIKHLNTFSIDYVDNDKFFNPSAFQPNSDENWVRIMANEYTTMHHYVKFDTPQLVKALTDAVYAKDLPGMADIDSSLWLFCKEVKKSASVALSGECADEIFGGYPWFHKEELLNCNTFPWIRALEEKLKVLSPQTIELIKPYEYVNMRYEETLSEVPRLEGESHIDSKRREMFYLNMSWFMQTLLDRKDRMSMAHGLEIRVPFCDHRLVQYIWNVPWNIKMLDNREKGLLRRALKGILPDDILYRKKSPYPKTHNPSYEKAVKEWVLEIIHSGNSVLLDLIDLKVIKNLIESKSDYGKPWFGQLMATPQLFAYLMQVDIWFKHYGVSIV